MGRFVKGDIVVLPFPFSDLSTSKRRPALVIAPVEPHDDVILCMVTSRNTTDKRAITISVADFASGSLPRESNVRPNRLFTANESIILRAVGRLNDLKIQEVISEVVDIVSS